MQFSVPFQFLLVFPIKKKNKNANKIPFSMI